MPQSRSRRPNSKRADSANSTTVFLPIVAALAVLTAIWFGGHTSLSYAILAIGAGTVLLIRPPRDIPVRPLAMVGIAAASACIAFLPGTWLGAVNAEWRSHLVDNWGFIFPQSISPQPELISGRLLEWSVLFLFGAAMWGQDWSQRSRRTALMLVTFGLVVTAVVAILVKHVSLGFSWPHGVSPRNDFDFGPFPNRNHFSSFCAIACILCAACAYDGYRRKSRLWILYPLSLLVPFAAIAINTSRAGLLLFFLGLLLWINFAAMREGFFKRVAISGALVLGGVAALILFGQGAGAKLVEITAGGGQGGSFGVGRLAIYGEALRLALESPWAGIGLGNFDSVFAVTHNLGNPYARFIHPESDWLWLWTEAGLLAVVALALVSVWILWKCGPWHVGNDKSKRARQSRRLRNACGIAWIMALLHSIVDTPFHNGGFCALLFLLAALGIHSRRSSGPPTVWMQHGFRILGIASLAMGALYYSAHRGKASVPGRVHLGQVRQQVDEFVNQGQLSAARAVIDEALKHFPMQWDLHYQRGAIGLELRSPTAEVLMDFGRARVLEPNNAQICLEEGRLWLEHEPSNAVIAWRECLRRRDSAEVYSHMLSLAKGNPEVQAGMKNLANDAAKRLTLLHRIPPSAEWDQVLDDLLEKDPRLEELDSASRHRLFSIWHQRGDKERLLIELESHPEWQMDAWRIMADEYARNSEFEKAWEIQKKFAMSAVPSAPSAVTDLDQLERNYLLHPTDPRRGIDLYFAQKEAERYDEALITLEKLGRLPNAPTYVAQEEASLHALQRDYRKAYELMKQASTP